MKKAPKKAFDSLEYMVKRIQKGLDSGALTDQEAEKKYKSFISSYEKNQDKRFYAKQTPKGDDLYAN
jgi:hypothetical protein